MQPVLGRGDDPGLVGAAECEGVAGADLRRAVRGGRPAGREGARGQPGGGDAAAADQGPSGERVLGQDSTAAVSRDSGSESALTAFARALISPWVRSS